MNAYNITLSKEEQSIAAKNNQKQDAVEELQVTIRNMQDKKEVLGMLKMKSKIIKTTSSLLETVTNNRFTRFLFYHLNSSFE